jgi:protein TonB
MMRYLIVLISLVYMSDLSAQSKTGTIHMKKEVATVAEKMPSFPGGNPALQNYLSTTLVYPQAAKERGASGISQLEFVVDTFGVVKDIKLFRSAPGCPECDSVALNVVAGMPMWAPGSTGGKRLDVLIRLPISFRLR